LPQEAKRNVAGVPDDLELLERAHEVTRPAASALLAGIPPADPATFLVAAVLCLLVTIGGSLAPSLRALGVDPIAALRSRMTSPFKHP